MNFSRERYVRVYTRDTADFLELSFNAKALWVLLLRKADRDGSIALGRRGLPSVARVIGHPEMWPELEPALQELLDDGCLKLGDDGASLVIPNFTEAQEATASAALRTEKWRERKRGGAASARDVSSPAVTRTTKAVTSRDVSSQKVTSGDEVRRGVTSGDPVPNRTVPYQHPPAPVEGVSGSTGTAEQAERERSADVEAVAARGRLIDPSLEHDAPRPNAAPQPPSVRLVLDLLNDGSEGAFALLGDSHSARQLAATVRELFESEDEIDAEAYAVLALWARERLGNGLAWAKRTGVGVKWLVTPGNLAAALGQSQGWWRRVGSNHQGELARLLGRFGLAPSTQLQAAAPSPAPTVPSASSMPSAPPKSPLTPAERRALLGGLRETIRSARTSASPGDRTCAAGPEAPPVDPETPPHGAQEPEQRPEHAPPSPVSAPEDTALQAGEWGALAEPEAELSARAVPGASDPERSSRPSRPPAARVIPPGATQPTRLRAVGDGGSDDR